MGRCLMKHAIKLNYGKSRVQGFCSLTQTRDEESGYIVRLRFNLNHEVCY